MTSNRALCRIGSTSPAATLLSRFLAIRASWLVAFVCAGLPATIGAAEPKARSTPSTPALVLKTAGALLIVGGGKIPDAVRDRFVALAGGKKARLVVVPTASVNAGRGELSPGYAFWRAQNVGSVEVLHTRSRSQADDPNFAKPLATATGVWLAGGDQSRLTETYLHTNFLRELRKVIERGGVVGGTSAGASVMSSLMITGGTSRAELGAGFGLLEDVVVDQHFTNRNRMGRLLGILADHPDKVGLGIDEQTAAVFQGPTMSIVGNANVWLCLSPTPALPVSVQRLKPGDNVDLNTLTRTVISRAIGNGKTTVTSGTVPPVRIPETAMGH